RQFTDRLSRMLVLAGAFGAVIGISGSLLSARAALPTGPVIVLSGTVIVLGALMMAPNRGVLWRAIALRRSRRETEATALLVDLAELSDADRPTGFRQLEEACAREPRAVRRAVHRLKRAGLVTGGEEGLSLSAAGQDAAERERERRRLWSTWLEHGTQLDLGDAREANPRDLRSSLGEVAYRRLVALAQGDPR
ncbi:MAG TPA: metal ABC transporter permease, partial [Miltoncostaeaceae bacterium]|nr:metal ABC transporter permease [Miltoncostaeaceae bacterium]